MLSTHGLIEGSNFLLDLLIVVVLWMMTSRESPDLDFRIEQSASAIASSAAILEICACCSFVNPTNLKLASPSVMRPSAFTLRLLRHWRKGGYDAI